MYMWPLSLLAARGRVIDAGFIAAAAGRHRRRHHHSAAQLGPQRLLAIMADMETPDKRWARTMAELGQTPVSRQGYLPDLEPLISSGSLTRTLLPRSFSSPACSPMLMATRPTSPPVDGHVQTAGVCVMAAVPTPPRAGRNNGRLWGTTFSLCSATLGAGALSLPYAFSHVGALGGVSLLFLTASASYYSIVLLSSAIARSGARSYEELTVRLFGKAVGVLVELNIVAVCYGSAIAYTVALGDLLHPLAAAWLSRRATMALGWVVLMLPLSMYGRISELRWASVFGVASVIYLVPTVLAHSGACAVQIGDAATATRGLSYWSFSLKSFESLAIMMFAFTCQVNVPALYAELEERSLRRMKVVASRAMGIAFTCYLLVGLAGYRDARAPRPTC